MPHFLSFLSFFFCLENIQNRAFGVGGYPEFLTAWKPLPDVLAIPPDNSNQIHLMISIDDCVNVKYVSRPVLILREAIIL